MTFQLHEQFLVDTEGHPKAVVLNLREYRKLLKHLEDLEDVEYIKAHRREKVVPLGQVVAELKAKRLVV